MIRSRLFSYRWLLLQPPLWAHHPVVSRRFTDSFCNIDPALGCIDACFSSYGSICYIEPSSGCISACFSLYRSISCIEPASGCISAGFSLYGSIGCIDPASGCISADFSLYGSIGCIEPTSGCFCASFSFGAGFSLDGSICCIEPASGCFSVSRSTAIWIYASLTPEGMIRKGGRKRIRNPLSYASVTPIWRISVARCKHYLISLSFNGPRWELSVSRSPLLFCYRTDGLM